MRCEDLCHACYLMKWKERNHMLLKTYFLLLLTKLLCPHLILFNSHISPVTELLLGVRRQRLTGPK